MTNQRYRGIRSIGVLHVSLQQKLENFFPNAFALHSITLFQKKELDKTEVGDCNKIAFKYIMMMVMSAIIACKNILLKNCPQRTQITTYPVELSPRKRLLMRFTQSPVSGGAQQWLMGEGHGEWGAHGASRPDTTSKALSSLLAPGSLNQLRRSGPVGQSTQETSSIPLRKPPSPKTVFSAHDLHPVKISPLLKPGGAPFYLLDGMWAPLRARSWGFRQA